MLFTMFVIVPFSSLQSIDNAGAYAFSMASVYNLRALPAEAVVTRAEVQGVGGVAICV